MAPGENEFDTPALESEVDYKKETFFLKDGKRAKIIASVTGR